MASTERQAPDFKSTDVTTVITSNIIDVTPGRQKPDMLPKLKIPSQKDDNLSFETWVYDEPENVRSLVSASKTKSSASDTSTRFTQPGPEQVIFDVNFEIYVKRRVKEIFPIVNINDVKSILEKMEPNDFVDLYESLREWSKYKGFPNTYMAILQFMYRTARRARKKGKPGFLEKLPKPFKSEQNGNGEREKLKMTLSEIKSRIEEIYKMYGTGRLYGIGPLNFDEIFINPTLDLPKRWMYFPRPELSELANLRLAWAHLTHTSNAFDMEAGLNVYIRAVFGSNIAKHVADRDVLEYEFQNFNRPDLQAILYKLESKPFEESDVWSHDEKIIPPDNAHTPGGVVNANTLLQPEKSKSRRNSISNLPPGEKKVILVYDRLKRVILYNKFIKTVEYNKLLADIDEEKKKYGKEISDVPVIDIMSDRFSGFYNPRLDPTNTEKYDPNETSPYHWPLIEEYMKNPIWPIFGKRGQKALEIFFKENDITNVSNPIMLKDCMDFWDFLQKDNYRYCILLMVYVGHDKWYRDYWVPFKTEGDKSDVLKRVRKLAGYMFDLLKRQDYLNSNKEHDAKPIVVEKRAAEKRDAEKRAAEKRATKKPTAKTIAAETIAAKTIDAEKRKAKKYDNVLKKIGTISAECDDLAQCVLELPAGDIIPRELYPKIPPNIIKKHMEAKRSLMVDKIRKIMKTPELFTYTPQEILKALELTDKPKQRIATFLMDGQTMSEIKKFGNEYEYPALTTITVLSSRDGGRYERRSFVEALVYDIQYALRGKSFYKKSISFSRLHESIEIKGGTERMIINMENPLSKQNRLEKDIFHEILRATIDEIMKKQPLIFTNIKLIEKKNLFLEIDYVDMSFVRMGSEIVLEKILANSGVSKSIIDDAKHMLDDITVLGTWTRNSKIPNETVSVSLGKTRILKKINDSGLATDSKTPKLLETIFRVLNSLPDSFVFKPKIFRSKSHDNTFEVYYVMNKKLINESSIAREAMARVIQPEPVLHVYKLTDPPPLKYDEIVSDYTKFAEVIDSNEDMYAMETLFSINDAHIRQVALEFSVHVIHAISEKLTSMGRTDIAFDFGAFTAMEAKYLKMRTSLERSFLKKVSKEEIFVNMEIQLFTNLSDAIARSGVKKASVVTNAVCVAITYYAISKRANLFVFELFENLEDNGWTCRLGYNSV